MEKLPILFVDDDASYLQLIKRIVDVNGIVDPVSRTIV